MLYVICDTGYQYLPCYRWYWYLPCYIWHMMPIPVLIMLYLTYGTWHRYLPCHIWYMIYDTDTCHAIVDTWYITPVLAMLYLTLSIWSRYYHAIPDPDIWHQYLPCYIWPMISNTGIWHTMLATWYLTCYACHLVYITPILTMIYMTPDTWHLTPVLPGICMIIITRHLVIMYLLYSCISCTPVSPVLLLLLIAQSFWRPAEHAWCRDDEDVSHNCASVWRILNGTKYHTEQRTTLHTWWGPPLEYVGATSRIHFPHRTKCRMEKSATPYTW